jgi:hypothetical protein
MAHVVGAQMKRSVDLAALGPPIFDQGSTNSCVGHALSRGIYIANRTTIGYVPSMSDIYRKARCYEVPEPAPLTDHGCDPADAVLGIQNYGISPRGPEVGASNSDADPDLINSRPDLLELGGDKVGSYHMIQETGIIRSSLVRAALSDGYTVCFDLCADMQSFQAYTASLGVLSWTGSRPDHYVCIVGYDTTPDGYAYKVANSWGNMWGVDGYCWVSDKVLDDAKDVVVCMA